MKSKDGRSLFREPKCADCRHWKVVHRGPQHVGPCSAIGCLCGAFSFTPEAA